MADSDRQYLVRKTGNGVTHIWAGDNTLCLMMNNANVRPDKYVRTDNPAGQLCKMCRDVSQRQYWTEKTAS